jgi:transposase-like protein
LEQKQAIVAESLRADTTPASVARRHGLNTGQLYTWRRQLRVPACPSFARVELAVILRPQGSVVRRQDRNTRPSRRTASRQDFNSAALFGLPSRRALARTRDPAMNRPRASSVSGV